jgi:CheY-like chemotaxis protein
LARTVLLADDSVTAQNMGRRILTDAGYEVITVNNGSAALKKIHESRPDLIVLDVYMPGYGGLEVCQRLKESEITRRIPVLLTVGKMEPFKTDEAKRVRADGHIIKPFDASELLAALTRLEDRIVPQSESGRGRSSKSDAKKSRSWKGEEIGADEDDDQRNDRISYLEEMKRRHSKPSKEDSAESAKDNGSLTGIERQARMVSDEPEEAVTFAAGPIYEPSSRHDEPEAAAPEFPVEKDIEGEQPNTTSLDAKTSSAPEAAETSTPEIQEATAEPAPVEAVNSDPAITSEVKASTEAVSDESEKAAAEAEPAAKIESTPRWVAENVALSAEEASRSLDEEMRQAQAAAEAPEQQKTQEAVQEGPKTAAEYTNKADDTPAQPEVQAESSGAAFAAAASASSASTQTEAVSSTSTPEQTSAAESPALDNWVGEKAAEAIAQSVAAMAESTTSTPSEGSAETSTAASSQSEADAPARQKATTGDPLSSIVDNVLAELKPRLLAEIAKQLANDKK